MDRSQESCIQRALVELAQPIVDQLRQRKLWVVTAESCTAGLIAAILSHARGAGECLHGGFVTYSKAHKTAALGVDPSLLRSQGSVNAEVARQMAEGALQHSNAMVAVSATGVLGPYPDQDDAPPGLVFVAAARLGFDTMVTERHFYCDNPDEVRQCAIAEALQILLNVVRREVDPGTSGRDVDGL